MRGYDVVVVGGGPAGVVAATQAGRAGARTLLVERSSRLGGVTVNAEVNRPGLFHAWGRQVIAGIGWELVERAVDEAGGEMPDFTDSSLPFIQHQPVVDVMVYASLCDEFVLDAGCDVLLHTMLAEVSERDDGWVLRICTKEGLQTLTAKQLIDCTGDANVVSMAGYPVRVHGQTQPATLVCHQLAGYDFDTLNADAINQAFRDAVDGGELKVSDGCTFWSIDKPIEEIEVTQHLKGHTLTNHVAANTNARDSAGRTAWEIEGRRSVYRMVRFFRRQPGLENLRVVRMAAEVGVRETVTIEGKTTVTVDDYESGRVWDDAVSNSFYAIDIHGIDAASTYVKQLEPGVVPTIPRGALLPAGSRNLLVAGRCLSSDRYANGAARVQASCMGMGQAVGALAVLAAARGADPEQVPMPELWALLERHLAMVPGRQPEPAV